MAYIHDLRASKFKVGIRRVESELPAYFIVSCSTRTAYSLFNNYIWIKDIEPDDPMPVFWKDWSEEE